MKHILIASILISFAITSLSAQSQPVIPNDNGQTTGQQSPPEFQNIPQETALDDDKIIMMVNAALEKIPEKLNTLKAEIRRVAFYSMKYDRTNISIQLARQIQGKIEALILGAGRPTLVYTPEVKPVKISAKENSIVFSSGFESTAQAQDTAVRLRLDGYMEGDVFLTKDTVYLNLRIFDAENMAVVWSNEFTSNLPPPPPPPPLPPPPPPPPSFTGIDFGFGSGGLQIVETVETNPAGSPDKITVPKFAEYNALDFRISEKTVFSDKLRFTLSAGGLSLTKGIIGTSSTTIKPSAVSGEGSMNLYVRAGMRITLVPAKLWWEATPANPTPPPRRDSLAAEISVGKLFIPNSTLGLDMVGIRFESDITRVLSIAIGYYYIGQEDIIIATGRKVRIGGVYYEISLLRFNFMP